MSRKIDEKELVGKLASMRPAHRLAFAASCCERLLPNFEAFHVMEGFGDPAQLRSALDTIWDCVLGKTLSSEEVEKQKVICEKNLPDPDNYSSVFTSAAINACSAVIDALDCYLTESPQSAANTGVLADDTVYDYIYRIDSPFSSTIAQTAGVGFDAFVLDHPLKTEELIKQAEDIRLLSSHETLTFKTIRELRKNSRNFGIQPFRRGIVK